MLLDSESSHWQSDGNRWELDMSTGRSDMKNRSRCIYVYASTVLLLLLKAGKHSLYTKGDGNHFNIKGKIELGFILFPSPSSVSSCRSEGDPGTQRIKTLVGLPLSVHQ